MEDIEDGDGDSVVDGDGNEDDVLICPFCITNATNKIFINHVYSISSALVYFRFFSFYRIAARRGRKVAQNCRLKNTQRKALV